MPSRLRPKLPAELPSRLPAMTDDRAAQLADLFRLLGDASRLKIVLACLARPRAVGEIAARLALSPSLVSHHLRLLRAARILRGRRRGKQVFYAAEDAHVSRVIADMAAHVAEPVRTRI